MASKKPTAPEVDADKVLLRRKAGGEPKPFTPEHAERLLNYPGSLWERAGAAPGPPETTSETEN